MAISEQLLEVLACPKCKGDIVYDRENDRIICEKCCLAYRVEDGIPVMLIEEADKI
jgi:hypothetical protein